jgi:hypothetical protein
MIAETSPRLAAAAAPPGRRAGAPSLAGAWLAGPVIGITNGVIRELAYKDRVGDLAGAPDLHRHRHRAVPAAVRRAPAPLAAAVDRPRRSAIGAVWLALTVLFEFSFGHWVDGKSWSDLLGDYNLATGHVWPLLLAWLALGPAVVRTVMDRTLRPESSPTAG